MFLKVFGAAAPVMLGALYLVGALDGPAYSQDVDQPPERVAQALADIDLDLLPAGEGAVYGSVPPVTMTRTANGLAWTVMSGDEVAMTMTASLTPLDGGRRTRVTGTVEKGRLSDPEKVSPAFRTPGAMEKLFSMALGAELAEFTAAGDPKKLAEARLQKEMASGLMVAGRIAANPEAVKKDMEKMERLMSGEGFEPGSPEALEAMAEMEQRRAGWPDPERSGNPAGGY
ncbi:MAG TPA: hypothetical protein VFQ67_11770 [Allosphingosinicella sp.]|jgi:hypothetical protein|nr:hypothetical protein [Allosphingosinicella sp.]